MEKENKLIVPEKLLKYVAIIGKMAALVSIMMWFAYIPQIMDNLAGQKTNPFQPLMAAVNCSLWASYGFLQRKKDWPIIVANVPGVFFALIACITGF